MKKIIFILIIYLFMILGLNNFIRAENLEDAFNTDNATNNSQLNLLQTLTGENQKKLLDKIHTDIMKLIEENEILHQKIKDIYELEKVEITKNINYFQEIGNIITQINEFQNENSNLNLNYKDQIMEKDQELEKISKSLAFKHLQKEKNKKTWTTTIIEQVFNTYAIRAYVILLVIFIGIWGNLYLRLTNIKNIQQRLQIIQQKNEQENQEIIKENQELDTIKLQKKQQIQEKLLREKLEREEAKAKEEAARAEAEKIRQEQLQEELRRSKRLQEATKMIKEFEVQAGDQKKSDDTIINQELSYIEDILSTIQQTEFYTKLIAEEKIAAENKEKNKKDPEPEGIKKNWELITLASRIARTGHIMQLRANTNISYLEEPIWVAKKLFNLYSDYDLLISSILFDSIEGSGKIFLKEIYEKFGPEIGYHVDALYFNVLFFQQEPDKFSYADKYEKFCAGIIKDIRILLIKLIDLEYKIAHITRRQEKEQKNITGEYEKIYQLFVPIIKLTEKGDIDSKKTLFQEFLITHKIGNYQELRKLIKI